ncbi:MAG: DJ-1/PfpI family protein [Planctomycetota bacterium]|nr:DJ-1/PfpI family protein [Planctomycetota bacterium]
MNTRTVGILIFDDVEVLDFAGPYEVFSRTRLVPGAASRRSDESAPFNVFTIARSLEPIAATGGLRVIPDFDFSTSPSIDLLVIPGGFGTRPLLDDELTLDWIRTFTESASITASVCTGALLLAQLGMLKGRKATTHWGALDSLNEIDPTIDVQRATRVVMDSLPDGLVTSAGVSSGIDMAFAMVEHLHGREVANETAHYIEYPRPRPRPGM